MKDLFEKIEKFSPDAPMVPRLEAEGNLLIVYCNSFIYKPELLFLIQLFSDKPYMICEIDEQICFKVYLNR